MFAEHSHHLHPQLTPFGKDDCLFPACQRDPCSPGVLPVHSPLGEGTPCSLPEPGPHLRAPPAASPTGSLQSPWLFPAIWCRARHGGRLASPRPPCSCSVPSPSGASTHPSLSVRAANHHEGRDGSSVEQFRALGGARPTFPGSIGSVLGLRAQ